jgi:hypothetical protein
MYVRLALKVVMQNDGDFVDVILLYIYNCCINTLPFKIQVSSLEVSDSLRYWRSVSSRTSAHGSCNLVRLQVAT